MTIEELCDSIYLGDRFCEGIEIANNRIIIHINCISRIREGASEWDYYVEKDIEKRLYRF